MFCFLLLIGIYLIWCNLVENFDPLNIAKMYIENGISFLSVLTEESFFLGKLDHIKNIKKKYKIPILCKDFFIDTYQIVLGKDNET